LAAALTTEFSVEALLKAGLFERNEQGESELAEDLVLNPAKDL
jgi:hypothetical protein